MELIIKHFANNEIRLQIQSEPFKRKNYGDGIKSKKAERHAIALDELIGIKRSKASCYRVQTGTTTTTLVDGIQLSVIGENLPINQRTIATPQFEEYIDLCVPSTDGKLYIQPYHYPSLLANAESAFNITKEFQRKSKTLGGWGSLAKEKRFGSYARHSILESGAVIDQSCPLENTYEVTLTLPGGSDDAIRTLAEWSGYVCNRLLQPLRRHPQNADIYWFYVWELQKRGALHMHWCISAKDGIDCEAIAQSLRWHWFSILEELSSKTGIDLFERRHGGTHRNAPMLWRSSVQQIRKSVAAYYSKYTCKDSENVKRERKIKRLRAWSPARWWGSSSSVKALVKAGRYTAKISNLTPEQAVIVKDAIYEYLQGVPIAKKYTYNFEIKSQDGGFIFCSGGVDILYICPTFRNSAFGTIRAIGGQPEERRKGETLLQSLAETAGIKPKSGWVDFRPQNVVGSKPSQKQPSVNDNVIIQSSVKSHISIYEVIRWSVQMAQSLSLIPQIMCGLMAEIHYPKVGSTSGMQFLSLSSNLLAWLNSVQIQPHPCS